jgi:hypothetical protein
VSQQKQSSFYLPSAFPDAHDMGYLIIRATHRQGCPADPAGEGLAGSSLGAARLKIPLCPRRAALFLRRAQQMHRRFLQKGRQAARRVVARLQEEAPAAEPHADRAEALRREVEIDDDDDGPHDETQP